MCEFFSCIATKDGHVLFTEQNSHETIIERAKLKDDDIAFVRAYVSDTVNQRNFVRLEILPPFTTVTVDEAGTLPDWWIEKATAMGKKAKKLAKKVGAALAQYEAVKDAALAQYEAVEQPALAQYKAVEQPAWAQYQAVKQPAWAQYQAVKQPAWAQYQAVKDAARAQYQAVKDAARAQYQAVKQPAWAQYEAVEQPTWAQYQAVKDAAWAQYQAELSKILDYLPPTK